MELCATTPNAESLGELSALWFTPLRNSDRACPEHYAIVNVVSQFNYVFVSVNMYVICKICKIALVALILATLRAHA